MTVWQNEEAAIRVLIVDDNLDVLDSLHALFELAGFTVRVTSSGATALASYLADPVDVVLVDLGMPTMNGFEFVKELRAEATTPLLIAMTGWARPGDDSATNAAGFDHYVTKPVDSDAIEMFIRRRLARARGLPVPTHRGAAEAVRSAPL
jgi:DNA-binding response OmpR family regulator